jgi:hypothetical protein
MMHWVALGSYPYAIQIAHYGAIGEGENREIEQSKRGRVGSAGQQG